LVSDIVVSPAKVGFLSESFEYLSGQQTDRPASALQQEELKALIDRLWQRMPGWQSRWKKQCRSFGASYPKVNKRRLLALCDSIRRAVSIAESKEREKMYGRICRIQSLW